MRKKGGMIRRIIERGQIVATFPHFSIAKIFSYKRGLNRATVTVVSQFSVATLQQYDIKKFVTGSKKKYEFKK
jgi:hypothetical protein